MEKLTFLVVDDEPNIARCIACSIQDILVAKDLPIECEILIANGPLKGVQNFRNNHVDFVISDLEMKPLNGEQFLQVVANLSPHTLLAMMTGDDQYKLPNDLASIDFLHKPLTDEVLEEVIGRALGYLLKESTLNETKE